MSRFIAAMDHSGGSTGGVLERYGREYTEDNKMERKFMLCVLEWSTVT